jgi:DNA-binding transcriptional LysR family regulator
MVAAELGITLMPQIAVDSELASTRNVVIRLGRNPKTGTEVPNSPRRVIVFTPSAILKQRINGHSRGGVA